MKPYGSALGLILASASPRRKIILKRHRYKFKIVQSNVSERISSQLSPSQMVMTLAKRKALAVAPSFPNHLVLGADTLVFIGQHVIGKPRNPRHASQLLKRLSGRWQKVYTGVCIIYRAKNVIRTGFAVSSVKMRLLTLEEIKHASHKHLDKAGAYAVQEKKDQFVEKIIGDYDNVVGLPIRVVRKLLRLAAR